MSRAGRKIVASEGGRANHPYNLCRLRSADRRRGASAARTVGPMVNGHSLATARLLLYETWRGGRFLCVGRKKRLLYSYVRFAAAASLIAFGSIISVGALVLVPPAVERLLVARAEISHQPATPCQRQSWLHYDRDCSSETMPRREVPSIAEPGPSKAVTIEVPSAAESVSEQSLTEAPHLASAPQASARQRDITAPDRATPVPPPGAEQRHSAKPVIKAQARLPVPKKAIRRDQAAKRSTSEALRTVRRFGDTLQDIPVSAARTFRRRWRSAGGSFAASGCGRPTDVQSNSKRPAPMSAG